MFALSPKGFPIGDLLGILIEQILYRLLDRVSTYGAIRIVWQKVSLSPKGFPIGTSWYPHWENRVSIRINVYPNQDSMAEGVVVTQGFPDWDLLVSSLGEYVFIRIKVYPNRDTVVDVDRREHNAYIVIAVMVVVTRK